MRWSITLRNKQSRIHSMPNVGWTRSERALIEAQGSLRSLDPALWRVPRERFPIGACFVCFRRGIEGRGELGEPGWAAAVTMLGRREIGSAAVRGQAGAPYEAGLLALREGPLLLAALARLDPDPAVILVNATGRDHPRRAGLALHLGTVLDVPTVGVTHRPLLAVGQWPPDRQGTTSALELSRETVGHWVRTRAGRRPIAVHAAWRTDPETAVEIVLRAHVRARTPEPIRRARRLARLARAGRITAEEI